MLQLHLNLFCLLLTCGIATSHALGENLTDVDFLTETPPELAGYGNVAVEAIENFTGKINQLQEALSKIASLEKKTENLLTEVATLRSHNIAMNFAVHALTAVRKHEIETLREEFEEAMNETREQLKNHGAQLALLQSKDEIEDEEVGTRPVTTQSWLSTTTSLSPTTASAGQGCEECDFKHAGYCFFTYDWYMSYVQAEAACAARGAFIGYPVDNHSYQQILATVQQKLPPKWTGWAGIWLGLSFASGTLRLPNGDTAPLTRWRSGEPSGGYNENRVMIMVFNPTRGTAGGMDDVTPIRKMNAALCMRKIA